MRYSEEVYLKQRRILNPKVFKEMNTLYLNSKSKEMKKEKYVIKGIEIE